MSLIDRIVKYIPVAYLPELIIRNYLPGDECLDNDTIKLVFTKKYEKTYLKNTTTLTFMDAECTVLHSFNDEPAVVSAHFCFEGKYWYWNGKRHRSDDKPASIYDERSMAWFFMGQIQ